MIRCVSYRWAGALCALVNVAVAAPLGTGFSFQGQIKHNGSPLNGTKTLRFSLWDAQSTTPGMGGSQLGNNQIIPLVPVSNGLFVVPLNAAGEFGADAFNGDARFLQVEVCETTNCSVRTILSPRQMITAVPYALQT